MTLPFENDTGAAINKLAKADLKAHKLKTFLSGVVILISTGLMAVVFTVLVNDALSRANRTPYHAMYQAVDEKTKEKLLHDSDFEAVGLYKNFGSTADKDGITGIAYMNPVSMELLGFRLLNGSNPEKLNEAAVSAAYMKTHGLSVGDTLGFAYTDSMTNQPKQRQFTICGVVENKEQEAAKQFYILTSEAFRLDIAGQADRAKLSSFSSQTPATVDVLLKLNAEKGGLSVEEKKEFLKDKGLFLGIKEYNILINTQYMEGPIMDAAVLAGIVLFAAFLMFASSFVIYSIFYISVMNSIQMYAQIMSLGMTGKQLCRFLKRQGDLLSLYFIPPGIVLALVIACSLSGIDWLLYDVAIALACGLLILAVIKAALRKPSGILARLSPMEAMKDSGTFAGRKHRTLKKITPHTLAQNNLAANRKNNRMAVVSLSISGTLMIALAILLTSFDLPTRLLEDYSVNEDFQIGVQIDNFYERFPQVIQANPLSGELVREISAIPGVEKVVKEESVIVKILEPEIADETGDSTELLESVSPELLSNISRVVSGSADYQDIGQDGIMLNQYRIDNSSLDYGQLKTGDTVRFQFELNGEKSERTFQIIGIAYFPSTGLFYTTPEVINSISPYENTSHLSVICRENSTAAVKESLQAIISQNPNLTLHAYEDDYQMLESFLSAALGSLYGISAFVTLFGLLNMVNMLISSAIVRKREFALLQAIGMTDKQLRTMLCQEGLSISLKSAAIAAIIGLLTGRLLCCLANQLLSLKFILFTPTFRPALLFAATLILIQILVTTGICHTINKQTLTERLRSSD